MKHLLLPALLLMAAPALAQIQPERYVDVNYRLTRDAIGYPSLADTATKPREPEILKKGNAIVIVSWPSGRWAEGISGGAHFFIRAANLVLVGHPPDYLKGTAPRGGNGSGSSGDDTSPTTRTGPRGGRYYINSNGNKTYIKH